MNIDTLIKELQEAKNKLQGLSFKEVPVLIRFSDEPLLPPTAGYKVDHVTVITIEEKTTTEQRVVLTVG